MGCKQLDKQGSHRWCTLGLLEEGHPHVIYTEIAYIGPVAVWAQVHLHEIWGQPIHMAFMLKPLSAWNYCQGVSIIRTICIWRLGEHDLFHHKLRSIAIHLISMSIMWNNIPLFSGISGVQISFVVIILLRELISRSNLTPPLSDLSYQYIITSQILFSCMWLNIINIWVFVQIF